MALDKLLPIYLPAIEKALRNAVDMLNLPGLEGLVQMLVYHLGWEGEGAGVKARGKRLRPVLVLLTTEALGGDWQQALPAASAVELVHNFSLIHDDIEDHSNLRRGRPTLWKLYGIAQAINTGDTMFSLAHLAMLQLHQYMPCQTVLRAMQSLQETCLALTQGQYLDLAYENREDIGLEDYWCMVEGKTAALISACTKIGAIIAQANDEVIHACYAYGRYLGLAFQVRDDFLGIWGDPTQMGKSASSDLIERKKSLPILYGLSKKGRFAERWHQGRISSDKVADFALLLEKEGAREFTEQTANQLTSQAFEALHKTQTRGLAGEALFELTEQLLARRM